MFYVTRALNELNFIQWRSQSAADARAQHGHTTFASSLVPRPHPAFSCLQYGNAEATRGVWGVLPRKILEFLSFLGRFWGYFRPYRRLEFERFNHFVFAFATNMRAHSVRSLSTYGKHIYIEIRGAYRHRRLQARACPGYFAYSYHKDRTRRRTACPQISISVLTHVQTTVYSVQCGAIRFRNCASNAA